MISVCLLTTTKVAMSYSFFDSAINIGSKCFSITQKLRSLITYLTDAVILKSPVTKFEVEFTYGWRLVVTGT